MLHLKLFFPTNNNCVCHYFEADLAIRSAWYVDFVKNELSKDVCCQWKSEIVEIKGRHPEM